mgnify:FL=1
MVLTFRPIKDESLLPTHRKCSGYVKKPSEFGFKRSLTLDEMKTLYDGRHYAKGGHVRPS